MKLLRVSVPNFRNLKNVELTFEPSLRPAVFPIGSENGGGKSTLLQLIFVLLTCSLDEQYVDYLSNFFASIQENTLIAKVDVIYKNIIINFDFYIITNDQSNYQELFILSDKKIQLINQIYQLLDLQQERKEQEENYFVLPEIIVPRISKFSKTSKPSIDEQLENNKKTLSLLEANIKDNLIDINGIAMQILGQSTEKMCNSPKLLICQTSIDDYDLSLEALKFASNHIYLAVPPTQTYLFLDKETKKIILSDLGKYQSTLSELKEEIPNLYIYNQLSITEISHAFKQARDQDIKTAINNKNLQYGTALKELVEDFHNFLDNDKYIFPSDDMTSIIVRRKTSDNEFIELEPEDLSHGELKRLGLYAWIKYNNINDSIILIDEIENGLHPDWQYNIVNELASWGDNQYLLATHSFYLCEALTPSHVKIIEPKLLNPTSEQ